MGKRDTRVGIHDTLRGNVMRKKARREGKKEKREGKMREGRERRKEGEIFKTW